MRRMAWHGRRVWTASAMGLIASHAARLRELGDDQPCSPLNGSRLSCPGHGVTSEAHLKGGPQFCGGTARSDARAAEHLCWLVALMPSEVTDRLRLGYSTLLSSQSQQHEPLIRNETASTADQYR